jgi:hypothetical protein
VDVLFYGNGRELEYDLFVAPGANLHAVQFEVAGSSSVRVDENGNLVLDTNSGELIQRRPKVYQMYDGERKPVEARYRLLPGKRVAFEIAEHDRALPLVIDPVLTYATYLGGSSNDSVNAIAVDSTGAVYVTGFHRLS